MYKGGSAPSDGDASFCVTPPSILTLYAIAGQFLRRLCLGLFYTVIGWPEFGDITIDGSHYGLDISRTGLHTVNILVNAIKSINQLKDIDSCKV